MAKLPLVSILLVFDSFYQYLTGYNINTSGQLYLRIWQLGESGALTAIDVLKIAFYADWSAITTNSQTTGITGPTSITAVQGPHP